ncbi:MAG: hypothetical protein ACREBR_01480, partial [bacterium]
IWTEMLSHRISDPQIRFQLFKSCVLPKIAHLELSDFLHTPPSTSEQSSFTAASSDGISTFLRTLMFGEESNKCLPDVSKLLAVQPVGTGGLGLRSTVDSRLSRFMVPVARSIRYAVDGIAFPTETTDEDHPPSAVELPLSRRQTFENWQNDVGQFFSHRARSRRLPSGSTTIFGYPTSGLHEPAYNGDTST